MNTILNAIYHTLYILKGTCVGKLIKNFAFVYILPKNLKAYNNYVW